jgi:hypothetical protein
MNQRLVDSEACKTEIDQIVENQKETLNESTDLMASVTEKYEASDLEWKNIITNATTQTENVKKLYEEFQNHLEFVESKREFFESRENYLQELVGREASASLFKTFHVRADHLQKSVTYWKWAVLAMAVLTILWVYLVFSWHPPSGDIFATVATSLRIIPAGVLLYFTIKQYSKERTAEEDYSFRAAVALTIIAYADEINDTSSRDDLVQNSVLELYKRQTDAGKPINGDTIKELMVTLKEIASSIKNITPH